MNKWVERAIFINIILIALFLAADYFNWFFFSFPFESLKWEEGSITDLRVGTGYNFFTKSLSLDGSLTTPTSWGGFTETSVVLNVQFLLLLLTIAANMLLLWRLSKAKQ